MVQNIPHLWPESSSLQGPVDTPATRTLESSRDPINDCEDIETNHAKNKERTYIGVAYFFASV